MQANTINKLALWVAAAGLVLLFTQSRWLEWDDGQARAARQQAASAPVLRRGARMAISGLDLVSFRQGQLSMGLKADRFEVRRLDANAAGHEAEGSATPTPEATSPAASSDELLMYSVHLRVYLDADGEPLGDWSGRDADGQALGQAADVIAGVLAEFPDLARVVKWSARPFELELYRGVDRLLVITAASASIVVGDPRVTFTDVTIEHPPSGRSLSYPEAWWAGRGDRLIIPQGYAEHGLRDLTRGGPVSLGLDFVPRPLSEGG